MTNLRLQKRLSGSLPTLQIDVSLGCLLQRIDMVNLHPELTRLKQREQLVDVELKFVTGLNVTEQHGTGDLDALGRQFSAGN